MASMNLPKNILVPTDFSDTASKALDFAIDLAEKLGARVTVLHTYEIPVVGFPDLLPPPMSQVASRTAPNKPLRAPSRPANNAALS